MSATPQEKIQKGFRPLVPGFAFGELNQPVEVLRI
jgi:acetylornithine/N-succinyldiaminopimelate aminotransferase